MNGNNSRRHYRRRRYAGSPLLSILFFPTALLYQEILLRLFDKDVTFFSMGLLRVILFSLAGGLFIFLIVDVIPNKKAARWVGGILMAVYLVVLCVERGVKSMFSMYYGIAAAAGTAGDAVGNFLDNTIAAVINLIPFILLSIIPLVLFYVLRYAIVYERGQSWLTRGFLLTVVVVFQLFGFMFSNIGDTKRLYTYDFTTNNGVPNFGLFTCMRLEFEYAVFGQPQADLSDYLPSENNGDDPNKGSTPSNNDDPAGNDGPEGNGDPNTQDPEGNGGDVEPPKPIEYGYNTLDIDFDTLAENASNDTIASMHEYFGALSPTQQNEYTGLFKGKNLILLTAESFCTYAIDPELTPTLYRLTQKEGFVFTNFYQPDWTLSTCGGEFSVTTGIIPNWIGSSDSARQAIDNAMPTTLGNMFKKEGYQVPAWHNGDYTFYSRNEYLPAFGYDYKGEGGGGLDLEIDSWPRSDKEMIEKTCDEYINKYLETGQPFHAYYMTISGHGSWTFERNRRAADYADLVKAKYPDLSEPCQAYIASNIDLDRALEVLVHKLESAGIADDTLIVMAADHYPYFLASGNSQDGTHDYYNELNALFGKPEDSERVTSRYHNTLLMWSASLERKVVDTPCYSCDIVPTVANLFGLEYDSRLYSGRDIFATNYVVNEYSSNMPLVVFADNKGQGNSWITAAGTYEASTGEFTPNPGVTVDDDYVSNTKRLVSGKIQFAKKIITEDYYSYIFD